MDYLVLGTRNSLDPFRTEITEANDFADKFKADENRTLDSSDEDKVQKWIDSFFDLHGVLRITQLTHINDSEYVTEINELLYSLDKAEVRCREVQGLHKQRKADKEAKPKDSQSTTSASE